MKTVLAAATALLAFTAVPARAADDDITYDEVVDCAAYTNIMGQFMLAGDSVTDEHKATAATLQKRAAALLAYAMTVFGKEQDATLADFKTHNDSLMSGIAESAKTPDGLENWMKSSGERCIPMGEAAAEAIDQLAGKK